MTNPDPVKKAIDRLASETELRTGIRRYQAKEAGCEHRALEALELADI